MKSVAKKLKNKETKSSLLVNEISNPKSTHNHKSIISGVSSSIGDDKTITLKSINKKLKHVKNSTKLLGSSLLSTTADDTNHNDDMIHIDIDDDFTIRHEPEIFIDTKIRSPNAQSYEIAMLQLSNKQKIESISHKNPSLEEFLDVWDHQWSDHQILSYFSKYLCDPRVIALDITFNDIALDSFNHMIIPKEIWQIIVSFEFGSAKNQIKRRYYHWIAHQRKQIYCMPFILGSLQCLGVFLVLFYVFVSGSSLHDAADIGAADITDDESDNTTSDDANIRFDIRFYCALTTVIAALIQICGALRAYYLARFRYSDKLKRFKRIIHLIKPKHDVPKLQIELKQNDADIDNDNDEKGMDTDEDNTGKDEDEDDEKYMKVRDLPNVEINFDIHQVPVEFRHIFLMKRTDSEADRGYQDVESDSQHDSETDDEIVVPEHKIDDDDDEKQIDFEEKRKKRLDYMMGIIVENDVQENKILMDEEGYNESLEEMQLILCGWESYIAFQRWINISSLVVTDNLCDPYLISFVLHKYLYVLCISTYVFGQGLTTFQSFIPFIVLFLSFSYLGLIVLDRISAKRAILYILSMLGCCGIIIGIFTGILFLLSFLFKDGTIIDDNPYGNNGMIYNVSNTVSPIASNGMNVTSDFRTTNHSTEEQMNTLLSDGNTVDDQQTWWITDFFYPILAFILCSNTIRRIRNGFDQNIPEIKYTLWSNCCFVSLIMTFATNSATWSNAEVKAVFLLIFVYMGYLWAQMRLHQAVTRLKKIDYANKYLSNSEWVKTQLYWSWLGQLSNKF